MTTEQISILSGFLGLAVVQVTLTLIVVAALRRRTEQTDERIDYQAGRASHQADQQTDVMSGRIDRQSDRTDQRLDDLGRRIDAMVHELAAGRERMARFEGVLDGFLVGHRDGGEELPAPRPTAPARRPVEAAAPPRPLAEAVASARRPVEAAAPRPLAEAGASPRDASGTASAPPALAADESAPPALSAPPDPIDPAVAVDEPVTSEEPEKPAAAG